MATGRPIGRKLGLLTVGACIGTLGLTAMTDNAQAGAVADFVPWKKAEVAHQQDLIQAGWRLVWQDDFTGNHISEQHWSHEVNCSGGGNNEFQCYTDRPENSYVNNGLLHIVAREEYPGGFTGPALLDDDPAYPGPPETWRTQPYTSARLRTKDKFDFTYGRVEVRARLAGGQGMWPAVWMLPTDWVYGGWPSSGEIDIVEGVNLGIWGDEVHGTLHYGLPWPQWENHGQTLTMGDNPADDFHVYAIEWEADEIRWYVDGVHYQTQQSSGWYNYIWQGQDEGFQVATPRAPFDQRFHLIMNLAVGGDWPGAPDTGWPEDREMLVDYVRVYQCHQPDEKPRRHQQGYEGAGCATVDPSVSVHADIGTPGVNEYLLFDQGPETLVLDAQGSPLENTPVPGQWPPAWESGNVVQSVGDTWDVQFNGPGNVFLTSQDMSGVEGVDNGLALAGGSGWNINGELHFDMRVHDASPGARLLVKMDSFWPNLGQVEITLPPADGEWYPVSVRVADIIANPLDQGALDVSNVNNLFVLEQAVPGEWVSVELDNIALQCAYNTEPESWQMDQSCSLEPRIASAPLESPVGFEGPSISYTFVNFDGGAVWLVDNPDAAGNDSGKVAIMQKYPGQHWGGTTLSLNRQVPVPDGASFSMKVWSQREVNVLFKLEAALPGEGAMEVSATHGGTGWEELQFDFGATPTLSQTDRLTLIFDLGIMGAADTDPANWTFYFDDIEI